MNSTFRSDGLHSGMEGLDAAFKWAIEKGKIEASRSRNVPKGASIDDGSAADAWQFYYGTWLAARGDVAVAIDRLSSSSLGVAKVLLARLPKSEGRHKDALKAILSVKDP